jgi:hypothetical protein
LIFEEISWSILLPQKYDIIYWWQTLPR